MDSSPAQSSPVMAFAERRADLSKDGEHLEVPANLGASLLSTTDTSRLVDSDETTCDWEEDLLAAAEGRGPLKEDYGHEDKSHKPGPAKSTSLQSISPATTRTRVQRTASIKYTPTEKYWLNRTYRAYRAQQAAQKDAKSKKMTYHAPPEGLLTHGNMMDSFNDRFAGKLVDSMGPRPSRERHAFGLWSAKNMREDDESMKGNLPDYWRMERKQRPGGISLEESITDTWDCDEYLGVEAGPWGEVVPQSSSKKRKNITFDASEGLQAPKKLRFESTEDVEEQAKVKDAANSRLEAYESTKPQRRYSDPVSSLVLATGHLRQSQGDIEYSWLQAQDRLELMNDIKKMIKSEVENALKAI